MRRKKNKEPLRVTSMRFPDDVKAFLAKKAAEQDRTLSYVMVEYIRQWIAYEAEQAKQPRVTK